MLIRYNMQISFCDHERYILRNMPLTQARVVSALASPSVFQVLRTADSSSLLDMSSDPFADLASSTEAFAREFRGFMAASPSQ